MRLPVRVPFASASRPVCTLNSPASEATSAGLTSSRCFSNVKKNSRTSSAVAAARRRYSALNDGKSFAASLPSLASASISSTTFTRLTCPPPRPLPDSGVQNS